MRGITTNSTFCDKRGVAGSSSVGDKDFRALVEVQGTPGAGTSGHQGPLMITVDRRYGRY